MKELILFCTLFFLYSCSNSENKNRKINGSFDKEIGNRIKLLNQSDIQTDSIKVNPNEVDSIVNVLIILSKDIENSNAAINKSNTYFSELSKKYQLTTFTFLPLKKGMHVDDVATTLKQNELTFFNLILLHNNRSDLLMHVAQ